METGARIEARAKANADTLALALANATACTWGYVLLAKGDAAWALSVRCTKPRSPMILLTLDRCVPPPLHRMAPIANHYGLPQREARILRLMLTGVDISEASERMGVTTSTGRTFLKHLYAKLGVSNCTQMVGLVLRLCPFTD